MVVCIAERELYYLNPQSFTHFIYAATHRVDDVLIYEDFVPVVGYEDHVFMVVLVATLLGRRFYILCIVYTIYSLAAQRAQSILCAAATEGISIEKNKFHTALRAVSSNKFGGLSD